MADVIADKIVEVKETKQTGEIEVKYPLKDFIENSKALGYRKEVVAGALFNYSKTELTKTEFEIVIKNFLGKKVE